MYWVSKFFSTPKHPDQFLGTSSHRGAFSSESNRLERGADNAFYFNHKIKNERTCIFSPPILSWHVYEQNLTFIFNDYIRLKKEQSCSDQSLVFPPAAKIPIPPYFQYSVCGKWVNELLSIGHWWNNTNRGRPKES
jgi:hypothetical protein